MNKKELLALLEIISGTDDMFKFFKVLVITIVQWPIELGPFLPGFIEYVKEEEHDKVFPPLVWLYAYILKSGQAAEEKGEADETDSK